MKLSGGVLDGVHVKTIICFLCQSGVSGIWLLSRKWWNYGSRIKYPLFSYPKLLYTLISNFTIFRWSQNLAERQASSSSFRKDKICEDLYFDIMSTLFYFPESIKILCNILSHTCRLFSCSPPWSWPWSRSGLGTEPRATGRSSSTTNSSPSCSALLSLPGPSAA